MKELAYIVLYLTAGVCLYQRFDRYRLRSFRPFLLAMLYVGVYLAEHYCFSLPLYYTILCAGTAISLFFCAAVFRLDKRLKLGLLLCYLAALLILPPLIFGISGG